MRFGTMRGSWCIVVVILAVDVLSANNVRCEAAADGRTTLITQPNCMEAPHSSTASPPPQEATTATGDAPKVPAGEAEINTDNTGAEVPAQSVMPPAIPGLAVALWEEDGRSVELVSIREHQPGNSPCWRPDGTPLAGPPPYDLGRLKESVATQGKPYEFAFHVTGLRNSGSLRWEFEGSTGWGFADMRKNGSSPNPDFNLATVFLDASATVTNAKLRIASGDWKPFLTHEPDGRVGYTREGFSVIFGEPYERDGDTRITLTLDGSIAENAVRLIAEDKAGCTFTATAEDTAIGKVYQNAYRFPRLRQADVKRFQLYTCPWMVVQFNNISLVPGQTTDCKVLVTVADKAPTTMPDTAQAMTGEDVYKQAQNAYTYADFREALVQFSTYLDRHSNGENAGSAQFWKAKCLLNLDRPADAVPEFEKVRLKYPEDTKAPYAIHNEAVCFYRMGQTQRAKELIQELIHDYPSSPAALLAKESLQEDQK